MLTLSDSSSRGAAWPPWRRLDAGRPRRSRWICALTASWWSRGVWGAAQAPAIQQFLDRVKGVVTLDCTALKYISSAGLGVLLKTQKRLMKSAGRLQLVGLNAHLRDVFQYSGVDRILEILEPRCRLHSATVGPRFEASSYTTAAVSGSDTGT